jgi:RND family efflux transporter MFP subunit
VMRRHSAKLWIPLGVLLVGALGAIGMVSVRPSVEVQRPTVKPPLVEVIPAVRSDERLRIHAQGNVEPRTESELVAEVSGRITWVSPSLASGGFIEAGALLARIDASDYEIAVERAEAGLARTRSALELARAFAARRRTLAEREIASPQALEDALGQERAAEAGVREARASLEQAHHDRERTEVRAPFAGRVREKHVDVGQFVNRGTPVARVYAVDFAEIRLPIPDEEAAFVDLPIAYRDTDAAEGGGPEVVLRSRFAGREHTWHGRVVRTEGEIDPRTRMLQVVARVDDPYGRGDDPDRPPLAVGLFVDAEILGRVAQGVFALPRTALHGESDVVVVDPTDRVRLRRVDVLRRERDRVLVSGGLEPGERVCVTPLAATVDGMAVRVAAAPPPARSALADSGDLP